MTSHSSCPFGASKVARALWWMEKSYPASCSEANASGASRASLGDAEFGTRVSRPSGDVGKRGDGVSVAGVSQRGSAARVGVRAL